ncbi:MEDS domain-containing protein [Peribacillus sp. NPDC097295]|uniref:MEDS domain-containing protein n=1 Tax=Peribacillus sp. NPDC097295 TaxID=3364402 RepID=UPI0038004DA4
MDNNMKQLMKELQESDGGHVFYCFNELDTYIHNQTMFIISGVEQGNDVLVAENDRIFPFVYKKLQAQLNEEQLKKVHHINNFDFYCFEGNFYPSTMVDYFSRNIERYEKSDVSLQTWGHIEWGRSDHAVIESITEYEKRANQIIADKGIISVCAYDECRMNPTLKSLLMKHHGVFMTDEACSIIGN